MRPYMLWLTRVYSGTITGYGTAFMAWPNVLDDWLRRCAEDRFRNERARQPSLLERTADFALSRHTRTPSENRRLSNDLYAAIRRARAAGQGGR